MSASEREPVDASGDMPGDLPASLTQSYDPAKSLVYRIADSSTGRQPGDDRAINDSLLMDTRQLSRWSLAIQEDSKDIAPRGADEASYVLRKRVGRGGFGEVWESVQVSLGRLVAVKRLRQDLLMMSSFERGRESAALVETFRQEAYTAAALDHPNIVPIYDLGLDENAHPLMAMKLVKGMAWSALLEHDFIKLPYDEYLEKHIPILVDVAQAVAFAHSRGIIHRDLKPSQVMTGDYGEVLLMDWGLAIWHESEQSQITKASYRETFEPTTRNKASNPAGTVAYMAPEQTEKTAENIGVWTDVYLLGGILYELLTGKTPHDGGNPTATFRQARDGHVIPLEKAAPGRNMPAELVDICLRALRPAREERHGSAAEFLQSVRDYLSGASRRRESAALTDQAAHLLLEAAGSYEKLADTLSLVARAQSLWAANPKAETLRTRALQEHARAALDRGDLALARLQAERIEGDERDTLLLDVTAAENAARRHHTVRRGALAAVVVLLVVGLAGMSIFSAKLATANSRTEKARRDAERQRDEASRQGQLAVEAKKDAVSTMQFLLADILPKLSAFEDFALEENTAQFAIKYYEKHPEEGGDRTAKWVRSRAYYSMGVILGRRDERAGAREQYMKCLEVLEGILKEKKSSWVLQDISSAQVQLGSLARKEDQSGLAREQFVAAIESAKESVKLEPDEATSYDTAVTALMAMGNLELDTGAPERSFELFSQARGLALKARDLAPENVTMQEKVVLTGELLADYHARMGNLADAIALLLEAKQFYEVKGGMGPSMAAYLRKAKSLCVDIGFLYWKNGQFDESLQMYNEALPYLLEAARDAKEWRPRSDLGSLYNQRAETLESLKRFDEALDDCTRAEAIFRQLHESDTGRARWANSLAWTLFLTGRIHGLKGNLDGATTFWSRARGIIEPYARDSKNVDLIGTQVFILLYLGEVEQAGPLLSYLHEQQWEYPGLAEAEAAASD